MHSLLCVMYVPALVKCLLLLMLIEPMKEKELEPPVAMVLKSFD